MQMGRDIRIDSLICFLAIMLLGMEGAIAETAQPPVSLCAPAAVALADPEQVYQAALTDFRQLKWGQAVQGFRTYLAQAPRGKRTEQALYYLASSLYHAKDYRNAITESKRFIRAFPQSPHVPSALLQLGWAYYQRRDREWTARALKTLTKDGVRGQRALRTLIAKYPTTPEAKLAEQTFWLQEEARAGPPRLGDSVATGHPRVSRFSEPGLAPIGVGSLPGRLFPDGTVCLIAPNNPTRCVKNLLRVPISKAHYKMMQKWGRWVSMSFYGIFDVDKDGHPEVFFDYGFSDDPNCSCITLVVYKKVGRTYRTYLKLQAQTLGYAPGAWFLEESPLRKAIFMTRYGGSSGHGLFYLDWKKRSLELITHDIFLRDDPIFEDLDKDGVVEIFVIGRGYDRTALQGAALLHWKDDTYQIWWPDWAPRQMLRSYPGELSKPYVMDAKLVDLDNDQQKEIVAVLDSEGLSHLRELGVWKLVQGVWTLADRVKLPVVRDIDGDVAFPQIAKVLPTPHGTEIDLEYRKETLKCLYLNGKISCAETIHR